MQNMIIIVDKEMNYTSRDVVNKISRILHTKKVGHTGTLDPIATGVLVVTVGKYTKLNDILTSTYKEYIAEFKLGILTDTLDITGNILSEEDYIIDEDSIKNALKHFNTSYLQEVPIYSAVKVNGRKLYDYARNNESIELPKREVDIKELELLSIDDNLIKIRCLVSKGTYIRSLIRDIGVYLNSNATMVSLRRIKQGIFSIDMANTIDDIANNRYSFLTIEDCLDVEVIEDYSELKVIRNGGQIKYDSNKEYLLFTLDGNEVALYKKDNDIYHMCIKLED